MNNMKTNDNAKLVQIVLGGILALIIFVIASGICHLSNNHHDDKYWNNGKCECGGNWVYEQAVGHYHSTAYIYKCDSCGTLIELYEFKGEK